MVCVCVCGGGGGVNGRQICGIDEWNDTLQDVIALAQRFVHTYPKGVQMQAGGGGGVMSGHRRGGREEVHSAR
jgi:hypothetical protein